MKRNISRKAEEAYLAETLRVVRDNVREYGQEVAKMQEDIDEMLEHYHDNDAEVLTILNNTVTMHTHMKRALERNEKALKKPYFGRIVFHDEALNKEESLYIGRGGIFRTVVVARPRGTATAQVRYLVVDFHTRRARLVHYAEDTFLRIDFFSFHHAGGVGRQTFGFVGFIRHIKAHHGHGLVFCHCTFFIHAATSQRFLLAWMQFHRQPVYFFQ